MRAIGGEHAKAIQSKKDVDEARRKGGRSVRRSDDVSDDEGSSPTRNAISIRL